MPPEEQAAISVGLHTLLLSTEDLEGFLEEVAAMACKVVEPPASCSITLRVGGQATTVATCDHRAAFVDDRQYTAGEGPCLEALSTGEPVEVRDLETDHRWPEYREQAVELGVKCSLSIPLEIDGRTLGAISLYRFDRPLFFRDSERRRIELFAAQAAAAAALAVRQTEQRDLTEQLEQALASRSVIDQAIGVLMAQEQCTADAAFDLLRRHSQNTNRKLRDVAAEVITRLTGHPPLTPTPFRPSDGGSNHA